MVLVFSFLQPLPFETVILTSPEECVRYLQGQWLSRGPQFLHCFTKEYRNYGTSSSQASEVSHSSIKRLFDNNLSDLHTLLQRLKSLVEQKVEWKQEYAKEVAVRRHADRNCPIKRDLATRITYRALDLLQAQFRLASSARLGQSNIGICTGAFTS